jgi:zinc transport system ATP-binding protein
MQSSEPLLEAIGLTRRFGSHDAVSGVGLRVEAGKIVTVIGPNGSGKTTLLRLLLGLDAPDAGEVRRRPGLRIGYMPQKMHLDPTLPLTTHYFLSLYACHGIRAEEAEARLGIEYLRDQQVQSLSGGELQRVMLARALLCKPDLLVLDEPVQGVDINGQAELYALISALRRETGCAVLMVSHDLHLVMSATDEVICLNHHICCAGHPQQVRSDPAFVALFGKHVADSLAIYTHHHDHTHDLGGHVDGEPDGHGHVHGEGCTHG